jgi:hypothetical protein
VTTTLRWVSGTQVTGANPCEVVSQDERRVALFQRAGSVWQRATGDRGGPRGRNMLPGGWDGGHEPREWTGEGVLRLHEFGTPWSVWRWIGSDGEWLPQFYVNLEDPWRRSAIGFDTGDWILDVVVDAELRWHYKDEDELEWASETGIVSDEWVARVRSAGRAVERVIEARGWPFDADWDQWKPSQGGPMPVLPDEWNDRVTAGEGR